MDESVGVYALAHSGRHFVFLGGKPVRTERESQRTRLAADSLGRFYGLHRVAIPHGSQPPIYHSGAFLAHRGVKSGGGHVVAALFLREPISRQKVAGVALGIAGALLLVVRSIGTESGENDLVGILLAVLSITGYGVYLIIVRSIAQKYTVITQMKWLFLFTALMMLPFGARDFSNQAVFSTAATWQAVAGLAFVILFPTMLGYVLTPYGLKHLRATTVSIYMNLQPIVASVVAIFVGQDIFSWDKPIAAALVIVGAYVVTTSRAKDDTVQSYKPKI